MAGGKSKDYGEYAGIDITDGLRNGYASKQRVRLMPTVMTDNRPLPGPKCTGSRTEARTKVVIPSAIS
jgi:hypothetical protein